MPEPKTPSDETPPPAERKVAAVAAASMGVPRKSGAHTIPRTSSPPSGKASAPMPAAPATNADGTSPPKRPERPERPEHPEHDERTVVAPVAPVASPNLVPRKSGPIAAQRPSQQIAAVPAPPRASTADATSVLPSEQQFPKLDGRTGGGRKKPESRSPLDFSPNQKIGRFELIREIARGGMGQVFLARDTKLGRKVAIKFLLHPDPNFVSRFIVEARATARCTHENIVTIFEVAEHEGLPFMVLEYLEGKSLAAILENQPSQRQFTEMMVSVVRALERAHEHGIVHRDLKPSNIFVTDRGHVKVLDFGVAKLFDGPGEAIDQVISAAAGQPIAPSQEDSNSYVTFSGGGSLVGTMPYMSPEQWGIDTVDHLSDLWAVGIMFWRALTKVHPAGTMKPEKLRERLCDLDHPLPSIGSRDASIPAELVAIVDRCLAKRKAARYQSAAELLADLQAFLQPKSERLSEDACPYRGLAAFGEGDAKFFFGRSSEIRTAMQQLEMWPMLAVIGPSGVGKSSFVHAGLVPAVRATGGDWQIRILRPGRLPLHSLASVLDDAIESGRVSNIAIEQLRDAPGLFGDMLRKEATRRKHKVMIVVDQLEELFTLSDDDDSRKLFLSALLAAADDPSAPVRVVLSMRADFLDRLAGHKHFLSELSRGLFFLSAPDQDNLRETLVRPAELAGYGFEDQHIVDDMMQAATSRGALPLLQFAATRLWDARDRTRKKLTASAYAAMGGVGGAFARHADEVAAAIPSANQLLLKAVMTRLVTPEGTRAIVDQRELFGLSADEAEVRHILDHLVRARLINLNVDSAEGTTTVEIVHEVLISEWPTLRRWLEDSHALRGFMHELRQAVRQWIARNRSSDLVWRGGTAQDALGLIKRHVIDLSTTEREYLAAVAREASRTRRRRVFAFTSIFAVLGVVFALGAVALIRIAKAQEQASEQASTARLEAQKARDAEAETGRQLALVKAEEARRTKAEAERQAAEAAAVKANADVQLSREELERANVELKSTLAESLKDKQKAQELAVAAKLAAEAARKATEEAKGATAKLQGALAREQQRVKQLELEKSKIATGGL
ncbi:MAG: protein kinase [Myxococcales bacterium]|nr:protein kinase [Myxococcales bacterium]